MSSLVTEMDWEALVEILQETAGLMDKHKLEPVKQGLLEVSSTAGMLELNDMAETVEGFKDYLVGEVSPAWEETKVAALRSAVMALVSAMQSHFYGPEFCKALAKVMIRETPLAEAPAAAPLPAEAEETSRAAAPQEEDPAVMDWKALIEILQETTGLFDQHELEPVKQGLLEVSSTAGMLELNDMAETVEGFKDYLVGEVSPAWEETKVAALRSAVTALIALMQSHFYGPEFCEALQEVVIRETPLEKDFEVAPLAIEMEEEGSATAAQEEKPVMTEEPAAFAPQEPVASIREEAAPPALDTAPTPLPPVQESEIPEVSVLKVEAETTQRAPLEATEAETREPQQESPSAAAAEKEEGEVTVAVEITEDGREEVGPDIIESYRAFLNLDPTSNVFVLLAEEYCRRNQWREAIMTCRRGLAAHPRDLRGRVLLGSALAELGQWEEAHAWLTSARRDLEANASVYEILARMAEAQGNHRKAAELTAVFQTLQGQSGGMHSPFFAPEIPELSNVPEPPPFSRKKVPLFDSASHSPGQRPAAEPSTSSRLLETLTAWLKLPDRRETSSRPSDGLFSDRERSLLRQLIHEAEA